MNYLCADASNCFPSWQVKRLKAEWLKNHTLLRGITNEGNIIVTPVVIATDHYKRSYLMDAITGTLYKNGKCMTSDYLELLSVENEEYLDKELLHIKSKALGG